MTSSSNSYDVAVVGGGVVGACVADEFAATGASVLVLDAGTEPGDATAQAAGVAVPSVRYLADPDFYRWLRRAHVRLEDDIAALEPVSGRFSLAQPILRALRPTDIDAYTGPLAEVDGRWVDDLELAKVAPALQLPTSRRYLLSPGLMVDGAGYLRAVRERALARAVAWRQGAQVAEITEDSSGVSLVTSAGVFRAEQVVVCAGAWSGHLAGAPALGPQRGQMVLLATDVELPVIFSSAFYLAPAVGGGILVGATEEDTGFDRRTTAGALTRLLSFAMAVLPELAEAEPVQLRSGLRPVSRTGKPLIGLLPDHTRTFVCAGHAGHGLLSARASAADLVAGMVYDEWEALPMSMCPTHSLTGAVR